MGDLIKKVQEKLSNGVLLGVIITLIPVVLTSTLNNYFEINRKKLDYEHDANIRKIDRANNEKMKIYVEYLTELHKALSTREMTWGFLYKTMELRLVANTKIAEISHNISSVVAKEFTIDKDINDVKYDTLLILVDSLSLEMRKDLAIDDGTIKEGLFKVPMINQKR